MGQSLTTPRQVERVAARKISHVGHMLVAPPANTDKFFEEAVILLYEESNGSTFGLTVNKQSDRTVTELCEYYGLVYEGDDLVYIGGPVNPTALIMIHSNDWRCSNTLMVNKKFGISSDANMLRRLVSGDRPAYWKLCLGMCKWTPEQLEREINGIAPWKESNAWLTGNPISSIIFHPDDTKCWHTAVATCGDDMGKQYFSIK